MLHNGTCACPCHDTVEGDHQAAAHRNGQALRRHKINGLGSYAVPVTGEIDAFFACGECQRHHTAALTYRPPPPPKAPYVDPAHPKQADGDGPE
jgi:hypothetical protein